MKSPKRLFFLLLAYVLGTVAFVADIPAKVFSGTSFGAIPADSNGHNCDIDCEDVP